MGRRLGQHFLTNRAFLERIASAVGPSPLIVEIGAGRGALTEYLVPLAGRLVAIELDRDLAGKLREKYPQVEVVEADVLAVDLGQWGPAAVAGNLPYYITSPILEKIFGVRARAVVLVQSEVAERLTASPGSRDYGYLTVHAQLFTLPELLFRVPAGAFSPPPKVESAAIRLTPRAPVVADPSAFLEFARRAFRHKRKTLRNNLAPYYQIGAEPEAGLRAEQLPLEQLADLWGRLSACGGL